MKQLIQMLASKLGLAYILAFVSQSKLGTYLPIYSTLRRSACACNWCPIEDEKFDGFR